jgi:hypothetical protein
MSEAKHGEMTSNDVTLYPTTPDYGDRFARLWERYHSQPASRLGASLTIALGAVCGLIVAWWL